MAIVTDSQPASRAVPEATPAEGPHVAHQPIIVAFAFLIVQRHAPLVVKLVTLLLLSAAETVAAAEALRYVPVVHRTLGLRPETRGA